MDDVVGAPAVPASPPARAGTGSAPPISSSSSIGSGTRAAQTGPGAGSDAPLPVIVEPPTAPQPRPTVDMPPQALTGARLNSILLGVVLVLAVAVIVAIRAAARRAKRLH